MKQIINGKKYDTDTAKHIGGWHNGLSLRDFDHLSEDLYLKKTGEYFLHGEGGAMTTYSRSNGNTSWGSSSIIPLSIEEAREWAEKRLEVDRYEEIFGECEE